MLSAESGRRTAVNTKQQTHLGKGKGGICSIILFAIILAAAGCDRKPDEPNASDGGTCANAGYPCGVATTNLGDGGDVVGAQFCNTDAGINSQTCAQTIKDLFKTAQQSIHIMIYSWCLEDIAEALINTANRHNVDGGRLDIKVVMDNSQPCNHDMGDKLQRGGLIQVSYVGTPNKAMHNKVVVIDNKVVALGSWNWTDEKNDDNITVVYSEAIVQHYEIEFYDVWNKADGGLVYDGGGTPDAGWLGGVVNPRIETSFCPQKDCYATNCPVRHCVDRIVELIRGAQYSVHIAANYLTLESIYRAVMDAFDRGLDVKIVIARNAACGDDPKADGGAEAGQTIPIYNNLRKRLGCNNVMVATKQVDKMHHKFMVIDGQDVELAKTANGSMNWSKSAKDNDENTVIIRSKGTADQYEQEFSRIFAAGDKNCYCDIDGGFHKDGGCD